MAVILFRALYKNPTLPNMLDELEYANSYLLVGAVIIMIALPLAVLALFFVLSQLGYI